MKILAIETSCDETAISIVEAAGAFDDVEFKILANVVHSQVAEHAPYGGVFPALAKREHSKNLIPVLQKALREADFLREQKIQTPQSTLDKLHSILEREPELREQFLETIPKVEIPDIDAIAVTYGPGLEPALWVGINFAKVLSLVWEKPLIPTNHMIGHMFSVLLDKEQMTGNSKNQTRSSKNNIKFPALSLLVSGGHTELVLMKDWHTFEKVGQTRDDAAGEAFDKVARLLDLPYPGGPQISALAQKHAQSDTAQEFAARDTKQSSKFPRPMLHSDDFDFSFSGLKTAVLYEVKKRGTLSDTEKAEIAYEFQAAANDVLVQKTIHAAEHYGVESIILGGGVAANAALSQQLREAAEKNLPRATLHIAQPSFTGDNATMIALAGYFTYLKSGFAPNPLELSAEGNLSL